MTDPAKTHYSAYGFHYIVGSSFAWLVDDEYSVAGRSFGWTRHDVVVALVYSESLSIESRKSPGVRPRLNQRGGATECNPPELSPFAASSRCAGRILQFHRGRKVPPARAACATARPTRGVRTLLQLASLRAWSRARPDRRRGSQTHAPCAFPRPCGPRLPAPAPPAAGPSVPLPTSGSLRCEFPRRCVPSDVLESSCAFLILEIFHFLRNQIATQHALGLRRNFSERFLQIPYVT